MALELPSTSTEVENRIKIDVAREAPDSNPYLRNHWLQALIVGFGRRIFDLYRDTQRLIDGLFPDTATEEQAEQWGTIYGVTRNPATQSTGNVVATGTVSTLIPSGTLMTAGTQSIQSTVNATITGITNSVTSITRSGTTATVQTTGAHGLASNVAITVTGAVEVDYNVVDTEITVISANRFTYDVANAPTTPATGTILADGDFAVVPVQSVDFGLATNFTLDTPALLQSPIAGADDQLNVDFEQLSGGADQETDAQLKARYLEVIRDPVAHFNTADITKKAKEVSGVTRVFVEESGTNTGSTLTITSLTRLGSIATAITSVNHGFDPGMVATVSGVTEPEYNVSEAPILVINDTTFSYAVPGTPTPPATGTPITTGLIPLGVVRVLFTRDNETPNIPSSGEVATVATKLEEIRPANTAKSNMIVVAPVPVPVDFTFLTIEPATTTMQSAVVANLSQFFTESTVVGLDITVDLYRAAIQNTVDTDTGDAVVSFTLSTPTVAVTINSGEIGVLGTVTF